MPVRHKARRVMPWKAVSMNRLSNPGSAQRTHRALASELVGTAHLSASTAGTNVFQSYRLIAVLFALAVIDVLILMRATLGYVSWPIAVLVHTAAVGVGGLAVMRNSQLQSAFAVAAFLGSLLAGPLAAFAFSGLGIWLRFRGDRDEFGRLNSNFTQLARQRSDDAVTLLHSQLRDGRARQTRSAALEHFPTVMNSGTLPAKQAVLGLIGRKYHPDYFPVLRLALSSSDMSVRVQAAAVFTRLRATFRLRLSSVLSEVRAGGELGRGVVDDRIADLKDCISSGFLDVSELRTAREYLAKLCASRLRQADITLSSERELLGILVEAQAYDDVIAWFGERTLQRSEALDQLHVTCLMRAGRKQEALALHRANIVECARSRHALAERGSSTPPPIVMQDKARTPGGTHVS